MSQTEGLTKLFQSIGKPIEKLVYAVDKPVSKTGFRSELNWSPESWFGLRSNKHWTPKDIMILESHIPEYLEIEEAAKNGGVQYGTKTIPWMMNPINPTRKFNGDPRTWVQMMSKNGQKYVPLQHWNGNAYINGPDYGEELSIARDFNTWTDVSSPQKVADYMGVKTVKIPEHYNQNGNGDGILYNLTYPKGIERSHYLHKNYPVENWKKLHLNPEDQQFLQGNYNILSTDDIVEMAKEAHPNLGVVRIANVHDGADKMIESVIYPETPVKSWVGNNGDFDRTDPSIYRAMLPYLVTAGTLGTGYGLAQQAKQGTKLKLIKRCKRN